MTEITYIINQPVKLSDHFTVPIDNSLWDGKTYNKTKKPWHPLRNRTIKFDDLLIPKTDYSLKHCTFGLYLLFFNDFPPRTFLLGAGCLLISKNFSIIQFFCFFFLIFLLIKRFLKSY